ncbi:MAG: class I SAM-dependent methyltransferase [Terriglobales bacterium]
MNAAAPTDPAPDATAAAALERLRLEFNGWQERGKGESMARHHRAITAHALERMQLRPGDRALDLGCGSGWATRLLADRVGPTGTAVGVDVSDAMIAEAQAPAPPPHVRFLCAPAEHVPMPDASFTHVLSVENFYYYPDQLTVLHELRRLLAPGGRIFLLMCLFTGNPNAKTWAAGLRVPVHLLSAADYREMLTGDGWTDVRVEVSKPSIFARNPDDHSYACLAVGQKA